MTIREITGPAIEPVTVEEAKAHLRVTDPEDDFYIAGLVRAARAKVESFTRLYLIEREIEIVLDGFAPSIRLPVWPVRSVVSISYIDPKGAQVSLSSSGWDLSETGRPRFIVPAYGECWPDARRHINAVRLRVRVGHGFGVEDVPADLRHALLMILGAFYENREAVVIGTIATEIPMGARALMQPHVFYF